MKRLLILTVAVEIAFFVNCLPLPAGLVVKYRVPSKFFSQPNASVAQGNSDILYSLLSQIHFGGNVESQTVTLNSIQSEDVAKLDTEMTSKADVAMESSTDEVPEVFF